MELTPASDTWVDTARLEAKIIDVEGNYASTLDNLARNEGIDPQTGLGPTLWNSWETTWTGKNVVETTRTRNQTLGYQGWMGQPGGGRRYVTGELTDQVIEDRFQTIQETGVERRNAVQTVVTEQFDTQSVGDRMISRDLIAFMRSRNLAFESKRMKPLTQMYGFFDGEDVTKYCVPKLLHISMISGTFEVVKAAESKAGERLFICINKGSPS